MTKGFEAVQAAWAALPSEVLEGPLTTRDRTRPSALAERTIIATVFPEFKAREVRRPPRGAEGSRAPLTDDEVRRVNEATFEATGWLVGCTRLMNAMRSARIRQHLPAPASEDRTALRARELATQGALTGLGPDALQSLADAEVRSLYEVPPTMTRLAELFADPRFVADLQGALTDAWGASATARTDDEMHDYKKAIEAVAFGSRKDGKSVIFTDREAIQSLWSTAIALDAASLSPAGLALTDADAYGPPPVRTPTSISDENDIPPLDQSVQRRLWSFLKANRDVVIATPEQWKDLVSLELDAVVSPLGLRSAWTRAELTLGFVVGVSASPDQEAGGMIGYASRALRNELRRLQSQGAGAAETGADPDDLHAEANSAERQAWLMDVENRFNETERVLVPRLWTRLHNVDLRQDPPDTLDDAVLTVSGMITTVIGDIKKAAEKSLTPTVLGEAASHAESQQAAAIDARAASSEAPADRDSTEALIGKVYLVQRHLDEEGLLERWEPFLHDIAFALAGDRHRGDSHRGDSPPEHDELARKWSTWTGDLIAKQNRSAPEDRDEARLTPAHVASYAELCEFIRRHGSLLGLV